MEELGNGFVIAAVREYFWGRHGVVTGKWARRADAIMERVLASVAWKTW
jgi:hypothetical protein